ncbi:MAG TPA: Hsp20/alpha crystallin family protein [Candidatus Micrarchaeia archaeon]|nr:Hsp20/alpha crystallin family protein [Candidatus Micrarchaeia archaeon]
MMVSRWSPWSDLFDTQGHLDQLRGDAHTRSVMPDLVHALPLDIRQTDDAFLIEASVPGFRPEDVELTLDENVLLVRAVRPAQDDAMAGTYIQRERRLGSVQRHVSLPAQVRAEDISAGFADGVLTITVPRAQKAQPKRIPVKPASARARQIVDAPVPAVTGGKR